MSDQHWFNAVALVIAIVVVVGFLAGLGLGRSSPPAAAGSNGLGASTSGTPDHVYMTIATNPVNGLDQFFPANVTVPSGVPVVLVFTNYDTGVNVIPGMPTGTSHSFTVPSLGLSFPIPAAPGDNTPSTATLTYTFHSGQYSWLCLAPCDPSSMAASGYMSGTVTAQ